MDDDTIAYMGWGLSAQEQIDGFRREVRELKAENALLWEQGALLFDKTLELGTENAKLRELVRLIYHHDRTPTIDELEAWHADGDEIEQRMRELGIEIPKEYE